MKRPALLLLAVARIAESLSAQPCTAPPSGPRAMAVISDLHFGPGMAPAAAAMEDFRWPRALKAFLDALNARKGFERNVDLVIAGDLFELWQHPAVSCKEAGGDFGCSRADIERVAEAAIAAHTTELQSLGQFASQNGNHVYIIPGNHDAALMLDTIWEKVAKATGDQGENVTRVSEGRWFSSDCRVAVEHGHQIGYDLNRFPKWPQVTATRDGLEFMWRPWGEAFVADQFNQVEINYPLIDNVLPLTSGLKLYLDEQSLAKDALDIAKLLIFNIFRTSPRQKLALEVGPDGTVTPKWDIDKARILGHRLVASAMPDDDPDRSKLLHAADEPWSNTRKALDARLADTEAMSAEDVGTLCDFAARYAREQEAPTGSKTPVDRLQCSTTLLIAAGTMVIPDRRVLAAHINAIKKSKPKVLFFIYGHTHQFMLPFTVRLQSGTATVVNDGAFQRLVSLDTLTEAYARTHPKETAKASALTMKLEDLPPCYNVALVPYESGVPSPNVWSWVFGETFKRGGFYRPEAIECRLR